MGLDFVSKKVKGNYPQVMIDDDTEVVLQIWDSYYLFNSRAGQEYFKSIVRSFYKNATAVFLVYNVAK